MSQLQSLPSFNSHHKYELPEDNLLPPPTRNTAKLLQQIEQQLFALCYNVENFLNLPNEKHLPDLNPTVWRFFHEVINLLPRDLDPRSIDDALIKMYETLYRSQSTKFQMSLVELINPGADASAPLELFLDGQPVNGTVPIEAVVNSSRYSARTDFELVQNALSGTDVVEYTVEFVPDGEPESGLADVPAEEPSGIDDVSLEESVPPKPARATKAKVPAAKSAKGKAKAKPKAAKVEAPAKNTMGKGKANAGEDDAMGPAGKLATRGKKTDASPAPAPTTRARSARIAAKTEPAPPPPAASTSCPIRAPAAPGPSTRKPDADRVGQKRQRSTESAAEEVPAQKKRARR
ncbi:hypothetical protein DFH08DRAFT_1089822 [Mycena albidolilacea]|uniref:Uncharacterized protein n=1 Tax=Mycena albidolilacea TaxID=1033008 RepID=A0AAD7E834_9AGAR|nr:hypothetical protein DFH08DRAFT_1089822 [Mycena albidolilacea]